MMIPQLALIALVVISAMVALSGPQVKGVMSASCTNSSHDRSCDLRTPTSCGHRATGEAVPCSRPLHQPFADHDCDHQPRGAVLGVAVALGGITPYYAHDPAYAGGCSQLVVREDPRFRRLTSAAPVGDVVRRLVVLRPRVRVDPVQPVGQPVSLPTRLRQFSIPLELRWGGALGLGSPVMGILARSAHLAIDKGDGAVSLAHSEVGWTTGRNSRPASASCECIYASTGFYALTLTFTWLDLALIISIPAIVVLILTLRRRHRHRRPYQAAQRLPDSNAAAIPSGFGRIRHSGSPTRSTPTPDTSPSATPPARATAVPGSPDQATAIPTPPSSAATPAPSTATERPAEADNTDVGHHGVTLPSKAWISLGLAATIAAVAQLLRLHRRRFARLSSPIPARTGPTQSPERDELALADAAGRSDLQPDSDPDSPADQPRPGARPLTPSVPAPIGVNTAGAEVSLFGLPGPGLAITGPGIDPAARAILASTLATGALDQPIARPNVVTTAPLLARLLPDGADVSGLDPQHVTFDGERLLVLADTGNAVSHAEEEMIARRRILDTFNEGTVAALNARADLAEMQPPYVVLVDAADRYAGRLASVAAYQNALDLYVVVLGTIDGIATVTVASDGTTDSTSRLVPEARLSTLTGPDLAQVLEMVSDAAARPEPGIEFDTPAESATGDFIGARADNEGPATLPEAVPDLPAATGDAARLAWLSVLGPVTITTDKGPITTGMRSGSYAVLAVLAAYPHGRTLDQIGADTHPTTDPVAAIKRLRTDITTVRRVLRAATGTTDAMFILYDAATGRYRIDPDTTEVDLWRMLTVIGRANTASDDAAALTALREAADLYAGDFAEGQDQSWVTDYATTHRQQILNVYARIAEILETDQPDAAIAALEQALRRDPLNEEIYQRIMRIQGRLNRPDAVRLTFRRLETQLADLGAAEPSEATRNVAARQLRLAAGGARP